MDFLLKRPKKWTSAHLQAVNPREYDEVAASAIVPESGLVANQDNCKWRELADQLASVPQSEIPVYIFADEKHTFDQTFSTLFNAVRCYDGHISCCELRWLLDEFLQLTMIHHFRSQRVIRFHLETLNVKGQLSCELAFFKSDDLYSKRPLMMCSVASCSREESKMKQEIPHAVFQMVMAYDQDPNRAVYTAFIIMVRGTSFQVTKAVASHSYMQKLLQGQRPNENLDIYRTAEYDLLFGEARRHFFWLFVGILTFLNA